MSLLPLPFDWQRARDILGPLGEHARAQPPSDRDLLDAALDAYDVTHDEIAPLLVWTLD